MNPTVSLGALALVSSLLGCQPDIGDPCQLPSDCSQTNEPRICDTTLHPNGYCTVFNCEPNGCPEEAVCVAYRGAPSVADGCRSTQGQSRLQRTWCMKSCSEDSDCRRSEGFACVAVEGDNGWGATVVDRGSAPDKICAIPYSGEVIPEGRSIGVCGGDEGELPVPLSQSAVDGGNGGAGGVGPDASPKTDASTDGPSPEGAVPEGTDAAAGGDAQPDAAISTDAGSDGAP